MSKKVALTEQYLYDIADAIRAKNGLTETYTPAEMGPAILDLGGGGIVPSGTINITTNGTHDVYNYANALVSVSGEAPTLQAKSVSYTPIEESQTDTVLPDVGYDGLSQVTIDLDAIDSNYIGSNISRNTSSDLSVSGATVTVPSGFYEDGASASVTTTTHSTPTASINSTTGLVTASHTQTTGYVTGGTTTGTLQLTTQAAKTVTPSTSSQTAVAAGRYTTGAVSVSAVPTEEKTATTNGEVTPSSGKFLSKVTVNVPTGSTINNQNKSVTPTESSQEVTADSGYTGLGTVTVGAISSTYVGSDIAQRSSTNLSVSGATVTAPSGYYSAQASKSVASGSLGNPTTDISKSSLDYDIDISFPSFRQGYISTEPSVEVSLDIEDKVVTPSTSQQVITPTDELCYLNSVTVNAMPSGTAGTPTATKGTVSNHSVSVTPTVTNTTGYITGGTKTGTAVTVTASELVSGSETKTSNGTYDVTNLAELVVNVPSSSPTIQSLSITPSTSEQTFNASSVDGYKPVTVAAMPTITLPTAVSTTYSGTSKATLSLTGGTKYLNIPTGYNETAQYYTLNVASGSATGPSSLSGSSATITTGTNTITLTKTGVTTTPTVSAGYVSSATASTASVSLTASVTVNPTPTASGATITIPAGYYSSQTTKSVSSGSASAPTSISGSTATVSTGTNTLTLTKTVSVTPVVSAGYVSSGTATNSSVSLSAAVTTKAATTYNTSTTDQTISSGTYLTGTQTIKAVTVSGLSADKILSGTTVMVGDSNDADRIASVAGTVVIQKYYTGSSAPSSSLGNNGDIYLQE